MNMLQAVLIGAGGGPVIGLVLISAMHRSIWGHWRFWRSEAKHRRPRRYTLKCHREETPE